MLTRLSLITLLAVGSCASDTVEDDGVALDAKEDGASTCTSLRAQATERFDEWFETTYEFRHAFSVAGHAACLAQGGGCTEFSLNGFWAGAEDGELILQIGVAWNGKGRPDRLIFLEPDGTEKTTLKAAFYDVLGNGDLLVSVQNPQEYVWGADEVLASVRPDGTIRWQKVLRGAPMAYDGRWGNYSNKNTLWTTNAGNLAWSYFDGNNRRGGVTAFDPETGEDIQDDLLEQLCNDGDPRQACSDLPATALARFEDWYDAQDFGTRFDDHYDCTDLGSFEHCAQTFLDGYKQSGSTLVLQIRRDHRTDGSQREIEYRVVLFDANGAVKAEVPGMYYFDLDPETIVISEAMASSGSADFSDTLWYSATEEIAAVSHTGVVRWTKTLLGGRPLGVPDPYYGPQGALVRLPDDGVLWAAARATTGFPEGLTTTVFDAASGATRSSPRFGHSLCR